MSDRALGASGLAHKVRASREGPLLMRLYAGIPESPSRSASRSLRYRDRDIAAYQRIPSTDDEVEIALLADTWPRDDTDWEALYAGDDD